MAAGETVLWGGPISLDSSVFMSGTYVARAAIPPSMRKTGGTTAGTTVYESVDPTIYVWGYFGTNTAFYSSKDVCVDTTTAFQNLKVYSATPSSTTYAESAFLTASTATMPATGALVSTSTALSNVYFNGGMGSTTTPCTSASPSSFYVNVLKIGVGLVDGNGNDNAAGFRIPFEMAPIPANEVATVTTASPPVISGQLLPGILPAGSTVSLFVLPTSTYSNSSISCAALRASLAPNSSGVTDANGVFSITSNITATQAASGVTGVLCAGAIDAGSYVSSYLISGGTPVAATDFSVNIDFAKIGTNQCHKISLNLTTSGNANVYNSTTQNFSITNSGFTNFGAFQFYTENTCTTVASGSSFSIPAGQTSANLYVSGTYSETLGSSQSLSFNDSALGAQHAIAFNITGNLPATQGQQIALGKISLSPGVCQDVPFVFADANGTSMPLSTSVAMTLNILASNISVYDSCAGKNSLSQLHVPVNGFSSTVGLQSATAVSAVVMYDVAAAYVYIYPTNVVNTMIQRAATSPNTVGLTGTLISGICEQLVVNRQDGSSNPISNEYPAIFVASSTYSGVSFYSDSSCSVGGGSSVVGRIAQGQSSGNIYVKQAATSISGASNNVIFQATINGSNGSSTNLTVAKPVLVADNTTVSASSGCVTTTFSLRRPSPDNDLIPLGAAQGQLYLLGTTWQNTNGTYLGTYLNPSDCSAGTSAVNSATFAANPFVLYLKNLSGTTNSSSVLLSPASLDYPALGSSPLTIPISLTP